MSSPPPEKLALYHYTACWACSRVRRAIDRLGLSDRVELRDIWREPGHRRALEAARGRARVPVLRITRGDKEEWLPESLDIIEFLERQVA